MSMLVAAAGQRANPGTRDTARSGFTLAAAVLGFFVITLDAVVVNVALVRAAVRDEPVLAAVARPVILHHRRSSQSPRHRHPSGYWPR